MTIPGFKFMIKLTCATKILSSRCSHQNAPLPPPPPNLSTFFYYVYPSVGMMKLVLVGFEVNDLNQRGKKRLYMMSLATLHVLQS